MFPNTRDQKKPHTADAFDFWKTKLMSDNRLRNKRLIAKHHGREAGPCVIAVAGIHGNEPTGIDALQRVLSCLERSSVPLRGDLYAYRGNLKALAHNVRYIHNDLNRIWEKPRIESLLQTGGAHLDRSEDVEMLELMGVIDAAAEKARGPVLVLDLHTSSAASVPFVVMGTGALLDKVNTRLQVPVIVDKNRFLRGMMLSFMDSRGFSTLAFEAGQHGTSDSIDSHETAVWLVLVGAGLLDGEDLPQTDTWREELCNGINGLPRKLELIFRHGVLPEDRFEMLPGFKNFDSVCKGQALARDRKGIIRSQTDGLIFLPLYQSVGDDGFFLVR